MNWGPDEVLTAVRSLLSSATSPRMWTYECADLDGGRLLLVFRVKAGAPARPAHECETRFAVSYSLADLPYGPNTGTACATPEEWAVEIGWDMDEQIETGGVGRAERAQGQVGVVLLRWRR